MAKKRMTYADYFGEDSRLEAAFRGAAGSIEEQEKIAIEAVRVLGNNYLNINDLSDYGDIPDQAITKWDERLESFGIKRGIPVGRKTVQFYKECEY